jgi:gluconate 2-dehydrogenase alpha chain
MRTLQSTDVLIIGGGWTGLLMAKELGARTSMSILVLERGRPRKVQDYADDMDELDYFVRLHMMQDPAKETVTVRHTPKDQAMPIRQLANFLPGTGIGGTGEHWGAVFPRDLPDCFQLHTKTVEKYGAQKLPQGHSIQDWGVTYDDLEPYYARAERIVGISGKAGNIRGKLIEGGNIFEGWRSGEYPMPPTKVPYFAALFQDAAKSVGYHPYANPSAVTSVNYTNPDGVTRAACAYCGFCERMGCMIGAKSQPTATLMPIVETQKTVSIRTGAQVRRIVHDGGKVRGVHYVDGSGEEVFQPAELVFLGTFTLNNTRLLLLSGAGDPYDSATGKGTLGKNLTHQVSFGVAHLFFDKPLNRWMGAGAAGTKISDFDGDVFDHSNLPFIRGGTIGATVTGTQPISTFGAVPPSMKARWGAEWKKEAIYQYDRNAAIGFSGEHVAYRTNYMDLDPIYKDHWGDPLLRMTIDWNDNERKMAEFMIPKGVEIGRAMGAKVVEPGAPYGHYDVTRYQSTHIQGGTIMAATPDAGVVNPYGQHWKFSNLFVMGASTFPNQASSNPTPTLLALTLRMADVVVDRYAKKPGALA